MNKQSRKAGLPPGSLVHIGDQKIKDAEVSELVFSKGFFEGQSFVHVNELQPPNSSEKLRWININGLHDSDVISTVGKKFSLHPLLLEDVLDTTIRPKIEEYDNCLFMSLKILNVKHNSELNSVDQISFILGNNWIISAQEKPHKLFDGLIQRMSAGKGKVPDKGVDYLLFRLLDIIVDHYFFIVESANDRVLALEEEIIDAISEDSREKILLLKKQLINFRKMVFPLRDRLGFFSKESNEYISEYSVRYFADVHENVKQIIDGIESQREMLTNVMDLYQSGVANKMNQVMQFLTIVSTVFIPLTFLAGIYGMNFKNMPELEWVNGYYLTLGIMVLITGGMLWYFKRKGWI
ncbi:MAG: magnesium/cobalt transporter CorA [Salibacteraceae bacterium]